LLSVVIFVSSFPLNAAGAYLVNVGDEWTYAIKEQDISQGTAGIKLTSLPAPPAYPRGDIYTNGTVTLSNQPIDEEYLVDDTMIAALEANYTIKTRDYGGVSCECVHITHEDGYTNVDTATGIVVEIYISYTLPAGLFGGGGSYKAHTWVISWSVTEIPEDPEEPSTGGGDDGIPGYDILFIIGIIAVISTVLTIGFKKKFKTQKIR